MRVTLMPSASASAVICAGVGSFWTWIKPSTRVGSAAFADGGGGGGVEVTVDAGGSSCAKSAAPVTAVQRMKRRVRVFMGGFRMKPFYAECFLRQMEGAKRPVVGCSLFADR